MNPLRNHPVFLAALVAAGLAVLGGGWCLYDAHAVARTARRQLELARRELRAVTALNPAATPENAGLIEQDLAVQQRRLAMLEGELADDETLADEAEGVPQPARRAAAFFEIAAFVEKMREHAGRNGVLLRPDERFSFGAYANEAPELGGTPAVLQERRMLQPLLEGLFAAHPRELLAVQREQARRTAATPAGTRITAKPGRTAAAALPEYFELDPRISLRSPGVVETRAFRFTFTGHTAVLREWLNTLADSGLPALVRLVEVTSLETAAGRHPPGLPPAASLIPRGLSRFTVTVEWVEHGSREPVGS